MADDLIALVLILACWLISEPLTDWLERLAQRWKRRP